MRKFVKGVLFIFCLTALILLITTTRSDAKPKPQGGSAFSCWNDTTTDQGCGGLICYCCYDDGCYICNSSGHDCQWDPKYSSHRLPKPRKHWERWLGQPGSGILRN
jgi:hypothetical protein